jgi:hypothetical protein
MRTRGAVNLMPDFAPTYLTAMIGRARRNQRFTSYLLISNIKLLDKSAFYPHVPPPCAIGVLPGRGKLNYVQPTS